MDALQFSMAGEPRGQGRPRATVRGRHATVYKDAKSRKYETSVYLLAHRAMEGRPPFAGPLSVSLRFRMPIPKSAPKRDREAMRLGERAHVSKPDLDNMVKAIFDGMKGAVFVDDAQIVRTFNSKLYADQPGIDVRVEPLGEPT